MKRERWGSIDTDAQGPVTQDPKEDTKAMRLGKEAWEDGFIPLQPTCYATYQIVCTHKRTR